MINSGDRYDYIFSACSCTSYVVYSDWSHIAVTEDDARVVYIIQKTTVKDLLYHEIKFCQEESTRNMKINIRDDDYDFNLYDETKPQRGA